MFFHSNQFRLLNKPQIVFNNTSIAYITQVKFLGIFFTENWMTIFFIMFSFGEGVLYH